MSPITILLGIFLYLALTWWAIIYAIKGVVG